MLLTMLLMLCLSFLSAADAQLKCDRSLITGVTNEQIEFDSITLKCTGKANSLTAIHILSQGTDGSEIRSKPFPTLGCHDFGWYGRMDGIIKVADASAQLKIACVEYCASSGSGFNVVEDIINLRIQVNFAHRRGEGCNLYHKLRNVGASVDCFPYDDKSWQVGIVRITSQIETPQHFDVRCNGDPPLACLVSMPGNHDLLNVDLPTKSVTCRHINDNALTGIIVKNIRFGTLQCDEANGWKTQSRLEGGQIITGERKIADANSELNVGCDEYCQATGDGIQFNQIGEGAELTCATDFKLYHNNQALSKATCDLSGEWTLEKANSEKTKDKSGSFECRPTKCYLPNIEGGRFDKTTKTLTCDTNGNAMIAIQVNSGLFTSVSCDIVSGWSGIVSSGGKRKFAEASAQLDAKCVKYCDPSEQSGQVQSVSGHALSTQFTCNGNNAEALEIRLNEKIVAPPLSCHMDRGYTDASGVKLAGSLDTVKVDCAIRPVPTTTTSSQQLPTSTMSSNDDPTTTHGSKTDEAEAQSSVTVVCASIGGVLLLIIAVVVIVIVLKKRRPENNSERPKAGSKEKHRKGNEKSGGDQNSSGQ